MVDGVRLNSSERVLSMLLVVSASSVDSLLEGRSLVGSSMNLLWMLSSSLEVSSLRVSWLRRAFCSSEDAERDVGGLV